MTVRPLTLHDENPMPDWVTGMLTASEANEDTTSDLWRWRALITHVDLPGPVKAVAQVLAWHCNSTRLHCYPSTSLLASEAGFTRKTVERAVAELEERGFVKVWREKWKNDGRRRNNVYAPAWPESYETTTADLCASRNRLGKPCRRGAGWGTVNESGPCKDHHRDEEDRVPDEPEMSAGDAVHTAGESHGIRQESPGPTAGESHQRSSTALENGLHIAALENPSAMSETVFDEKNEEREDVEQERDELSGDYTFAIGDAADKLVEVLNLFPANQRNAFQSWKRGLEAAGWPEDLIVIAATRAAVAVDIGEPS